MKPRWILLSKELNTIASADDIVEACNSSFEQLVEIHSQDSDTVSIGDIMESLKTIEKRLKDFLFLTVEIDDGLKLISDYDDTKDTYVVLSVHDITNLSICNSIIPSMWYRPESLSDSPEEILHADNNHIPFITTLGDIMDLHYRDKKSIKRIIEILYKQKTDLDKSILITNHSMMSLADKEMRADKYLVTETIINNMSDYYKNLYTYYNKTIIDTINNINLISS